MVYSYKNPKHGQFGKISTLYELSQGEGSISLLTITAIKFQTVFLTILFDQLRELINILSYPSSTPTQIHSNGRIRFVVLANKRRRRRIIVYKDPHSNWMGLSTYLTGCVPPVLPCRLTT